MSTFWFLHRLVPETLPSGTSISIDLRVVAFAVLLAGITTAVFGAAPAIAGARSDVSALLHHAIADRGLSRLRGLLTASEVAITVVVLISAGLLLRSLAQLRSVKPGFRTSNLLIVETVLPPLKYSALQARTRFTADVLERTAALPGVVSAGFANFAPFAFKGGRVGFRIEGRPDRRPGEGPPQQAVDRTVSPGFFEAMGIPVLGGRVFERRDTNLTPPVAVISQAMARAYWPGQDPVGQRIRMGGRGADKASWLMIVGVVAD
jgi:putative ABC transport system permease protein